MHSLKIKKIIHTYVLPAVITVLIGLSNCSYKEKANISSLQKNTGFWQNGQSK